VLAITSEGPVRDEIYSCGGYTGKIFAQSAAAGEMVLPVKC